MHILTLISHQIYYITLVFTAITFLVKFDRPTFAFQHIFFFFISTKYYATIIYQQLPIWHIYKDYIKLAIIVLKL